jgi:hypothetical protein
VVIVIAFPPPPRALRRVLDLLDMLRRGDPEEMAGHDLTNLPRPWIPATCPDDLRELLWAWCDDVVSWLNHEYGWRPTQLIPACWPQHPHIAHELPALALLRWHAEQVTGPEALEEWHRQTFSTFSDRLAVRLGESTCRSSGQHQDWPADGRHASFISTDAADQRQTLIFCDSHPDATP